MVLNSWVIANWLQQSLLTMSFLVVIAAILYVTERMKIWSLRPGENRPKPQADALVAEPIDDRLLGINQRNAMNEEEETAAP
ncbi:hypothetical protein ACPOL_6869 (plasmid) [Acidisarcina polymorpha]|uniref:Uncharacterized protein n=1 Tax=Acidisarcina polymorpha TaxID=2211140 RepID=A0A2Z5GB93_9BACT|nr:hypothetical protein [Acidisarcina polymorpha]AXC16077.1 hypothetical protein ACPOL_6869 [Acidisarcina polymorpha]